MLYGGALYVEGKTVSFTDKTSTFEQNFGLYGGGLLCVNCATVSFTSTTFENNYANEGGAVLLAYTNGNADFGIGSTFSGSSAAVTLNKV